VLYATQTNYYYVTSTIAYQTIQTMTQSETTGTSISSALDPTTVGAVIVLVLVLLGSVVAYQRLKSRARKGEEETQMY
jgi:hypothetical protein